MNKSNPEEKISNGTLIKHFGVIFFTIAANSFVIIEIIKFINEDIFVNCTIVERLFYTIVIPALVFFIYTSAYLWIKLMSSTKQSVCDIIEKDDSILSILDDAYQKQRWKEVVKIGSQLSGALWYTGKFELREEIAEYIEPAAAMCQEFYIQSEVLIDDLGWTKYRLNKKDEALKNIEKGLSVASAHNYPYLIAKAHRHFADIYTQNSSMEQALVHYNIASDALASITDSVKKTEMEGNLQYTYAKYMLHKRNYDEALTYIDLSMESYENLHDSDRKVKLFNWKGKILLAMHRENEAVEIFQEGLRYATTISNNVHMTSNSLSLAECYLGDEKFELARRMLNIAKENSKAMNDPVLKEKINNIERKIIIALES